VAVPWKESRCPVPSTEGRRGLAQAKRVALRRGIKPGEKTDDSDPCTGVSGPRRGQFRNVLSKEIASCQEPDRRGTSGGTACRGRALLWGGGGVLVGTNHYVRVSVYLERGKRNGIKRSGLKGHGRGEEYLNLSVREMRRPLYKRAR